MKRDQYFIDAQKVKKKLIGSFGKNDYGHMKPVGMNHLKFNTNQKTFLLLKKYTRHQQHIIFGVHQYSY